MIRQHCDFCGKHIDNYQDMFSLRVRSQDKDVIEYERSDDDEFDIDDLCRECVIKLKKILRIE